MNRDHKIAQRNIAKPLGFRSAIYRFSVMMGLTRSAAGGFGEMIPEPVRSGSGYGYHGLG